jgi:hypothetical protein
MEDLKTKLSEYGLVTDCTDINNKITINIKLNEDSTFESSINCLNIINEFYDENTLKKSLVMNDKIFEYIAIKNG